MMNLPYPFDNASGIQPNAQGSISLIDARGKFIARIPMNTAFELSKRVAGGIASGGGTGIGGNGWREGDGCTARTSQK